MQIPRVAAVHDLSGLGRCSLTMAIPVLSVMGVQCCPMPTAVLSAHTGFSDYSFIDLTEQLPAYMQSWVKQGARFDAIFSGFLGSERQLSLMGELIDAFPSPLVLIDPVMGDDGKPYSTYTPAMCAGMKSLIGRADLITPNVTEACILTDTPYHGDAITPSNAYALAARLAAMGPKAALVTGVREGEQVACYGVSGGDRLHFSTPRTPVQYSGTGDLFASVLCGALCSGTPLKRALALACTFVYQATDFTMRLQTPPMDGIVFEPLLHQLGGTEND